MADLSTTVPPTGAGVLVGRDAEAGRFAELAERVASDRGGVLVVEGEPGIGKTALLRAAEREFAARGLRLLRGTARPQDSTVPFAAIATCLRGDDPSITRVLELLQGQGASGDSAFDHEVAVIDALLALADEWCTRGPVAVILDDTHWADASSLLALDRLAESTADLPLLIVLAMRPLPRSDALSALLYQLTAKRMKSLHLAPLAEGDIAALVARTAGVTVEPALRSELAAAGGNPLYAIEMAETLRRSGGADDPPTGPRPPLPASLTDAIVKRLEVLPAPVQRVLNVAAALGGEIDAVFLAEVVESSILDVWNAVAAAVDAELLDRTSAELVFRHELIRQVLADRLPPGARAELATRAAHVMISKQAPAERIAHYLLSAGDPLDDRSMQWLLARGFALISRAPELAIELFERATADTDRGVQRTTLQLLHLRGLLWAGRAADAETLAHQALSEQSEENSPTAKLIRWTLILAHYGQGHLAEAAGAVEIALSDPRMTLAEEAKYHAFLGAIYLFSERFDDAERSARRAIEAGTATDDPLSIGLGCNALGGLRYTQGRLDEALTLADRLADAHRQCERRGTQLGDQLDPYVLPAHSLIESDRLDEAEEILNQAITHAPMNRGLHLVSRARLFFLAGRWDDALAEIAARRGLPDIFGHGVVTESLTALIAVHRSTEVPEWTPPARDDRTGSLTYLHFDSWVDALLLEAQGKLTEAADTLADASRSFARGLANSTLHYIYPDLARLAARAGDRAAAAEVSAAAEAMLALGPTVGRRATAALCRGLAADDPDAITASAQQFRAAGRPLFEATAWESRALLLARAGRNTEARSAVDAAIELYSELGAQRDIARAEALLREHGIRRVRVRKRPKSGWGALTPTENKVVELVAQGRSNTDIAGRLCLSHRTVQTHVSNILAKLDLQSRLQVAVAYGSR
ncbi:helix-turn-helix transcriptional regulator [Nocardia alni]|uniref:helix-turn-helix transcriptional regulator n=1 Tax=Nocardia alni TaxID=2815723 RepID=UPI001C22047D|nr:AAA family ATPase [Nocardia alni]